MTLIALAKYLKLNECTIKFLKLVDINLDDLGCQIIATSLLNNSCLEELDISKNILCSKLSISSRSNSSNSNSNSNKLKKPNVETPNQSSDAGESLSILLDNGVIPLKKIKLCWNSFRSTSSNILCKSLMTCKTLICLDLSYNKINRSGALIIGKLVLYI